MLKSYRNYFKTHKSTPQFAVVFDIYTNKILEGGCSISRAIEDYGNHKVDSIQITENEFVIGIK